MERIQGKEDKALEIYVAALCIYPFENHLVNRQLWAEIADIHSAKAQVEGEKAYQELIQSIHELIETRQGYFSYLNNVRADRNKEIPRVLSMASSRV